VNSLDRRRSGTDPADERGTVTVWMLGMLIMVLFLGGLSMDLWRAFSARRSVAGIVDAAAIAGASGIDEPHLRATGEPRLDPQLAYDLAAASLASHRDVVEAPAIDVAADGSSVTVVATRDVPFTLLRVLLPELDSRRVGARATSPPRRASP
jgi:predicted lipid-binding transport protein (Tim44 family)